MAAQVTNESQTDLSFFSKQFQFPTSPTFNCLQPPPSSNSIIIIDDDDEDVTLEPKKKPILGFKDDDANLFDGLGSLNFPPTFNYLPSLPLSTLEPMRKKRPRLGFPFNNVYPFDALNSPTTINYLGSPPLTTDSVIIIDDDDDDLTLEPPKNKKPRVGFQSGVVNPLDELSNVFKGVQETKEKDNNGVASVEDSCLSDLNKEKKNENNVLERKGYDDDVDDDETLEPPKNKKSRLGFQSGVVNYFDELSNVFKGVQETKEKENNGVASVEDSCLSDLNKEKKNENNVLERKGYDDDDDETQEPPKNKKSRLGFQSGVVNPLDELSKVFKGVHETPKEKDNNGVASKEESSLCDLNKEKKKKENNVPERKGNEHVTLEDLGVTVEDLKNIPWEAFDPTWEIRSDPWLCNYYL